MLPLWRNRVYIALTPERISLVKMGRGLKPKLQVQIDDAIQPLPSQPLWQAAVDKLAQVLAQPEWHNADADIVLSNRLARFAVIPPNAQLRKYSAQEAFARHVLSQTYGGIVSQWVLRIQHGKASEPWLVSAIDQSLLDSLKLICTGNKLKLDQVAPWLVPVFNRFGKQITADPAWLVINEPGTSLCTLIKGGEISCMSNLGHGSIDELPVLLDRENLVSGLSEPCKKVYFHAPAAINLSATNKSGYEFNRLEMQSPPGITANADDCYAMALSGALS